MRRTPEPEPQPRNPDSESDHPPVPRLFLREPGWNIAVKHGSDRMFCYVAAPEQDHYHRITDGEVYLYRGDEKVCLPCADRHGLLNHEPRVLRQPVRGIDVARLESDDAYELEGP